ncbi:MAG: glycosyltransferase family 2 protein [Candidatus Woesearchaeota archaeon]|nr:glycosyltransferase family 2 protein [Candidatus Woesearchaeota archaeon]
METAVIILNWNGKRFLKSCFDSLLNQTYKDFRIIFVDNCSKDSSVDFIKKNYRKELKKIKILQLNENTGFAKGNNEGIREALKDKKTKYVVTLNNDTIANKDFLKELTKKAQNRNIGMVSSRILFLKDKKIDTLGLMLFKSGLFFDIKNEANLKYLFCPCGCAALYKRELLEDIKLNNQYFDEDFFAYAEDADLGFRAVLRSWKCAYAENAVVYHMHQASSSRDFLVYHIERNTIWAILRNMPGALFFRNLPWFILTRAAILFKYLFKGKAHLIIKARLDVLKKLGKVLNERKSIQKNKKIKNKDLNKSISKRLF